MPGAVWRNYGVVCDVTSWADVLPEFGGDTYSADNFMQGRDTGFPPVVTLTFLTLLMVLILRCSIRTKAAT